MSWFVETNGCRSFEIIVCTFILEVIGSCGAVWGWSEIVTLRNTQTTEFWRMNTIVTGLVFLVRFLWQGRDFCQRKHQYQPVDPVDHCQNQTLPNVSAAHCVHTFGAKLILEVFGSGGAVWGLSEALLLRTSDTTPFWRIVAASTGGIFLIRFIGQGYHHFLQKDTNSSRKMHTTILCIQMHASKMVLEVWGGVGAIWGFSEAITLRNTTNVSAWRTAALFAGFLFLLRWLYQICISCRDNRSENFRTCSQMNSS